MKIKYFKNYDYKFYIFENSNGKAIFELRVKKLSIVFVYYRSPCNIVFRLGGKNENSR